MTENRSTWPQLANVVGFVGALIVGGSLLLGSPSAGGETSEDENRTLAPAPTLTAASLLSGTYTAELEAFVADHFPQRDLFISLNFWLKEHRGFHDEQLAVYDIEDIGEGAVEDGLDQLAPLPDEALAELDDPVAMPGQDPIPAAIALDDMDLGDDVDENEADGETKQARLAPRTKAMVRRGLIVSEGRAMQIFTAGPDGAPGYARTINYYADTLADKGVNLYVLIVPTAQAFYMPEKFSRHAENEPANIRATQALLRSGVTAVDVYSALKEHSDEYIYFRTDHHWTGRGAYYAYDAFCKAAGLTATPMADMERRTLKAFHGPLYKFTRDATLAASPDTVEYWVPKVATTTTRYNASAPDDPVPGKLLAERGVGYGVFLGGDAPLMVVKTAENPGRRALLLKNSYGNAFSVFLAQHFEETLIVDYRHFRGRLLDLIEKHKITDLVILNGAITANASAHVARIGWVLDRKKPPASAGAASE